VGKKIRAENFFGFQRKKKLIKKIDFLVKSLEEALYLI
jgi:hypothetical protein